MARITRKTQKIFASTAGGSGVAEPGSTAAGTPVFTTNLTTLQSTAFLNGLADMVIAGTKRLPVYEEINALYYTFTTQLAYLFQEGIAEWDSGTTYYAYSVVRKSSTYEIYGSLINDNLNNALPSAVTNANWQYLGSLANLSGGITALTGDVTASGTGSVAATIAAGAVSNSKMANMNANTVKVNATGSAATPTDLALSASTVLARSASGNMAAHTLNGLTASGGVLSAKYLQEVSVITGAVATGTTVMPFDDTIPQNTEGDQYMTLGITPTSATNKLEIEVVINLAFGNSATNTTAALFQSGSAGALAAVAAEASTNNNCMTNLKLTYTMLAGSTSPLTFNVRAGNSAAGTTTFNGETGARRLGGVMASSIVIREIAA